MEELNGVIENIVFRNDENGYTAAEARVQGGVQMNLDGAGRLTQFFRITIPLIWTNIRTTLTFFIISTINMAFLFVTAMTSGGPNGASDVALNYMYSQKNAGLYGYSMAIGVAIFVFSFALSACINKATSREPLEF